MWRHSCNWHARTLQIPSPLTAEMEAVRKDKLAERNRAKKKQKREREKQAKEVRDLDRIAEAQQKAKENLSEREKVPTTLIDWKCYSILVECMCTYMIMLLLPCRAGMTDGAASILVCTW